MSLNIDRSSWKRSKFGDLVANINDYYRPESDGSLPYVAGPHIDAGLLTVSGYGSTDDPKFPPTFKRKFRRGDVLLHSRGIEKLASVDRVGVTGEKLFVLRSIDENVLSQSFLLWLLKSPSAKQHMADNFTGSVNKFLNWRPLANFEFDLPPLDEQKRIADLLWAIERHRLEIAGVADSLSKASETRLAELWKAQTGKAAISDIADCVTGSTPPKANAVYWTSSDVPFYTPSEIQSDTMAVARQGVSVEGATTGRWLPQFSVAVACIGGDMGKSAVIQEPGISNQQITSVVGLSEADAYLLQSLLAHPLGRRAMEARETTTIVRKLNKSDLMKVEVPWPVNRSDAQQLVERKRAALAQTTTERESLRQASNAILAEIFGGN